MCVFDVNKTKQHRLKVTADKKQAPGLLLVGRKLAKGVRMLTVLLRVPKQAKQAQV